MSTNNIYADSKVTTETGETFPQYIYFYNNVDDARDDA